MRVPLERNQRWRRLAIGKLTRITGFAACNQLRAQCIKPVKFALRIFAACKLETALAAATTGKVGQGG